MDKLKKTAQETVNNTKRVVHNGEAFVQAVALLTIAAFSYYALQNMDLNTQLEWVVTVALVVIGLRGAYEFVSFLNKEK